MFSLTFGSNQFLQFKFKILLNVNLVKLRRLPSL